MIQLDSSYRPTPWRTLVMEWQFTYRSARRDGHTWLRSAGKFMRGLVAGLRLDLGLHPRYDRHGRQR